MLGSDPKDDLRTYLQRAREAMLWKLDGLAEYDARRPMTPTGTNLLGLVKHLACVEAGYFGDTFGRPFPDDLSWLESGDRQVDLWAAADESRADVIDFYRRSWAHTDATVDALPLDAIGHVPWWPADRSEVTLHRVLVHMIAETERHAGHADICREYIDGAAGNRPENANLPEQTAEDWRGYYDKLERLAREVGGTG
jgi:hypothetical protein